MTAAGDCVFCRIVNGSLPCSPLVETATVLAFMDVDPVTRRSPARHPEGWGSNPDRSELDSIASRIVVALEAG